MNRLKAEPAEVVRTVPELLGVARRLAADAVDLYAGLAARMDDLGNERGRAAFAALEAGQRRHAETLDRRIPPEMRRATEPTKRSADLAVYEDEDLGRSRLVTPYLALAVAVRNEERAFAFWSYISAHAEDPEVGAGAERLAREELNRIQALRAARRRAYHAGEHRDREPPEHLRTASLEEFLHAAARRDSALAELHGRIAHELEGAGHKVAPLLARIAREEAASARSLAGDGEAAAGRAPEPLPTDPGLLLDLAQEQLEAAVEFFLTFAERSQNEDVVAAAQRLSHAAIGRLALLGSA